MLCNLSKHNITYTIQIQTLSSKIKFARLSAGGGQSRSRTSLKAISREIHRFWPLASEFPIESTSRIRDSQSKFPTKWNREIIVPSRELNPLIREAFRRIREGERFGPICPRPKRPSCANSFLTQVPC